MIITPPKICIVDDEDHNNYLFKDIFEDDFDIIDFTNPKEALAYLLDNKSVLTVITDQSMPELRGLELARSVKGSNSKLSFIMLTGNPESDNELKFNTLRDGLFFDFLTKPFDFDNDALKLEEIILASCSHTAIGRANHVGDLLDDFKSLKKLVKNIKDSQNLNISLHFLESYILLTRNYKKEFILYRENSSLRIHFLKDSEDKKIDDIDEISDFIHLMT